MITTLYKTIRVALVVIAAIMASATMTHAADSKTTARACWDAGIEAYGNRDYSAAVEAFENIVALDYASAEVYYNLANAYFRLGQQAANGARAFDNGELGKAVLNYERALKLDPTMENARYNIDIAKELTNDTEAVPESFITRVWRSLAGGLTTNAWATISLVMLFMAVVLALVYLLHSSLALRKMAFFFAVASLLVFILSTALSLTQLTAVTDDSRAVIVVNDTTPVHASPDSGSKIIRQPSQGVTVVVERVESDWTEVRFADGEEGWVRTSSVEVI